MGQSITYHLVSRRLGRLGRDTRIIASAIDELNRLIAQQSETYGPAVQLSISGPHFTKRSVSFILTRIAVDSDGKAIFEPYPSVITVESRLPQRCLVTGPANEKGQIPVLIRMGGIEQAALANPEDLAAPPELQRQRS